MSEKYIDCTAAGKHDKHDSEYIKSTRHSDGYNKADYVWYADNGRDIVLIVNCKDRVVTDVIKYFEWVYWTSDGMPKFWASKPTQSTKNSTSKDYDKYGAKDYNDPEDFYEDNYDDFDGYEDAEDYYNEYAE